MKLLKICLIFLVCCVLGVVIYLQHSEIQQLKQERKVLNEQINVLAKQKNP